MSVPNLIVTSPDELILVSDLEPAGDASEVTGIAVKSGTITATAMYETCPVCKAVDKATPAN